MSKKSMAWKDLERSAADALGGERVTTPWFLFEERPDAVASLPDGRRLIIEAKYRQKMWHHSVLNDCQTRYCQGDDVPCLITKSHNQVGAYCTLPMDFVSELLKHYRNHEGNNPCLI